MKNLSIVSLLGLLVLAGIGCTQTSSLSAQEAANSLSLQNNAEILIRPTVFGVGGAIVEWLGSEGDEWKVSLTEWSTSSSVGLSWSVTSEVETDESKAALYAYEEQYAETPIGIEIPDPPEQKFEQVIKTGSLSSQTLEAAQRLTLPQYWPEGAAGVQDSSLIWLSTNQYNELVNTRATSISLGLFDESVMQAENAAETMQGLIDQFKGLFPGSDEDESTEEATDALLDITTVNADGDWGTYTLSVNNVRTKVRTIEAENKFATYTILANPNNPIILEIKLSPLAQGTVQAFNPTNIAESFSGYEIVEINPVVSAQTDEK